MTDGTSGVSRDPDPASPTSGRAARYRVTYLEQARKLAAMGAVDSEIADFFAISTRQLIRWKLEHPAFAEATRVGEAAADDRVERSLYQKAVGYYYTEQQAIKIKIQEKAGTFHEEVVVVDVERFMPPQGNADLTWLRQRAPRWSEDPDAADREADEGLARATVEGVLARMKLLDDEC